MKVWVVDIYQDDSLLNYILFLNKDKALAKAREIAEEHSMDFVPGCRIRYENPVPGLAIIVEEDVIE